MLLTTQFAYQKGVCYTITCDTLLCTSHSLQSALESGQEARIVQLISVLPLIGSTKEEEVRGERTKSGAEIMTSQDGCRCEL